MSVVSLCRECAAAVVWCETRNRRRMALNLNAGDRSPNIAVQRVNGRLLHARVITPDNPVQAHEEAYVAHWVTCPAADRFRRNPSPSRKTTVPAEPGLF